MTAELRAGALLLRPGAEAGQAARPARRTRSLARPVTKVGIVGAGLMASQLALLFVRRLEVPVVLTDLDQARVDKGVGYVHGEIDKLLAKGRVDARQGQPAQGPGHRLRSTRHGFADADFVIEAVFEEMSVKQQVFAEVEAVVSPECVLATNTSSLSITEMAAELEHPERVVGFHFFNPVAVMPLLEIVARRADRRRHAGHRVRDRQDAEEDHDPGQGHARRSSSTGCSAGSWARSAGSSTRAPRSRSPTARSPGSRRCRRSCCSRWSDRPSRCTTPRRCRGVPRPVLRLGEPAAGRRGGQAGFYVWDGPKPRRRPRGRGAVRAAGRAGRADPRAGARAACSTALADEARRMLDEGVVAAPEDLDLAMITGAGFSFWNGGLTPLLDREGLGTFH